MVQRAKVKQTAQATEAVAGTQKITALPERPRMEVERRRSLSELTGQSDKA